MLLCVITASQPDEIKGEGQLAPNLGSNHSHAMARLPVTSSLGDDWSESEIKSVSASESETAGFSEGNALAPQSADVDLQGSVCGEHEWGARRRARARARARTRTSRDIRSADRKRGGEIADENNKNHEEGEGTAISLLKKQGHSSNEGRQKHHDPPALKHANSTKASQISTPSKATSSSTREPVAALLYHTDVQVLSPVGIVVGENAWRSATAAPADETKAEAAVAAEYWRRLRMRYTPTHSQNQLYRRGMLKLRKQQEEARKTQAALEAERAAKSRKDTRQQTIDRLLRKKHEANSIIQVARVQFCMCVHFNTALQCAL
jgi:hypothetical protein